MSKLKICFSLQGKHLILLPLAICLAGVLNGSVGAQVIGPNSGGFSNQSLQGTSAGLQQPQTGLQGSTPTALGTTSTDAVLSQNVPTLLSPTGQPIRSEVVISAQPPVVTAQNSSGSNFLKILAILLIGSALLYGVRRYYGYA